MRILLVFLLVGLLLSPCFAALESDSIDVFAVTDNSKAISAELGIHLRPGTGKIWTSVEPLIGTSTQSTEKLAVEIARDYSTEVDIFDYFFEIKSNASLVEGPSAGAAMTLLLISMLQNKQVPDNVAITGTITTEGGIGPVGGVFEKAKEASKLGIKLFMVPPGELRQTVKIDNEVKSVNLIEYAEENWGLKIVEVGNINEVLKYAFKDIEEIDVDVGNVATEEFVPIPITLDPALAPMSGLTKRYIVEAEDSIRSAKNALSGTLLEEAGLIDVLLRNLNESEKTVAKSKILADQNYLYSAANYAFLATINSAFVRDIAENPALLSRNSTAFSDKVQSLNARIDSFSLDLNKFVPLENFEWHVAAKERLVWAKHKLKSIDDTSLVIIVEQDSIDWERVSDIRDYEYALAWHSISQDFFELTKTSTRGVLPDQGMVDIADSYIANSENALPGLSEEELVDITRRLDSSKLSRELGWYYASLFDSASSLALINASAFSKNKDLAQLQISLDEKILQLEKKLGQSDYSLVWARLYLDHSKYYLDSSLFYQGQGQLGLASDSAKSGIALVFLAEGIFDAANASYAHIESLPNERLVQVAVGWQDTGELEGIIFVLSIMLAVVVAIMVFGVIVSGKKVHLLKSFSFEDKLDEVLSEQRSLRKRLDKGYITSEQFDTLNEPIQNRLNKLLAERRALSADYVALDLNKTKAIAFEHALRALKADFKKKRVTAEDFESNSAFYQKRIALLNHLVAEEEKKIDSEKKKAEAEFSKRKKPSRKRKGKQVP